MKIAFFTESYGPYLSGVTVSIETLAKYLTLVGHRVWIFAPDYPTKKKVLSKIFRLPSFPTKKYPGFRVVFPLGAGLWKKIKKISPDIIHTHSPYTLGFLAKLYARKLKIPLIYSFHTVFTDYLHYFPFLPASWARFLLEKYFQWFLKNTPVIVPTDFIRKMILPLEPAFTYVIPTGIDFSLIEGAPGLNLREKLKLQKNTKILLYVGRLSREKNIPFLFEVTAKIAQKRQDFHLVMVASGPEEANLKKMAVELNLNNFISFVPQVSHQEIFSYYKAADLFVLGSLSETQGIVLVEAMAAGLSVVAIEAKGVSDIIKTGTGFLVAEDPKLFADKVLELLADPDKLQKIAGLAQKFARENYSGEVMAQKISRAYQEQLKK